MIKKFTLGGLDWVVKETEGLDALGLCDPEAQIIYIKAGQNDQCANLTFFHELFHAMLFTIGETQHDEKFVEAMAHTLFQFTKTAK